MKKTYYSLIAVAVLTTSAFSMKASASVGSNVTLYGNLIYDETNKNVAPSGIYSTDVDASASVKKVADAVTKANGGACLADTAYFAIEYTTKYGNINACYLNSYNPVTWALTNKVEASHSSVATSLTFNPVTKKIYGSFYSEEREGFYFGTLDPKTADCDTIAFLDHSFNALASDATGTLYFVNDEGKFGKIGITDGAITIIGDTGFKPKFLQDATFDYGTKQFYWCAFNDDDSQSGIYTVDLSTGKATRISTWATGAKEFVGVFSKTPVFAADVPEIPASLVLTFAESALSGKATFTMPSLTYGGTALSGELDYICKQYFGLDVPASVAKVTATRTQSGASIKWEAVTEGAHGAKFDPSTVTYNVTRFPDNVVVASGVKNVQCADDKSVDKLASYYYEVVAVDGDYQAAPTKSNGVILGEALQVPYNKEFSDGDFSLYTIIDANADGTTWGSDFRGAKYLFNNDNAGDDWLISPPLRMKANQKYNIVAQLANAMNPYTEKAEVKVGDNATAEAMKNSVIPATTIEGGYRSPMDLSGVFSPTVDGDYFVGIHAISDAGALYLYCYKLEVTSEATGITSTLMSKAVIRGENGNINITGANGAQVVVAAIDGRIVAQFENAANELSVPVGTGVYVVTVNNLATKVIVK